MWPSPSDSGLSGEGSSGAQESLLKSGCFGGPSGPIGVSDYLLLDKSLIV